MIVTVKIKCLISAQSVECFISFDLLKWSIFVTVTWHYLTLILNCVNYVTNSVKFSYILWWNYNSCLHINNYRCSSYLNQNSIVLSC